MSGTRTPPSVPHVAATLVRVQGAYYVVTGVWPILHLRSFLAVTGDKRERWLVRTFGSLTAAVGASLARPRPDGSAARLGWSTALAIGVPEIALWRRGTLPLPYLLDGILELGFAAAGIVAERSVRAGREATPNPALTPPTPDDPTDRAGHPAGHPAGRP